ncbi:WD40 repeat domain-containing protein [Microcoleus sp. Pol12B5]|uniref:WD40 repeat domain-containing protein n=1 Tax=Microcoleus sp. Pol12B5 TaxID=3055396 RepID=UPI002FD64E07
MLPTIIAAIAPYISGVLSPIARNIGHKLGEAFGNNSQKYRDFLIPAPNNSSDSTEIERAKQRYSQEMLEYAKAKDTRDRELLKLTVAQTARRIELQEQEQRDRLKLAALQRDLMRELQAKDIQVKLAEIQTIWDKDTWFSKLNREETKQILLQQQHRLLILLSPPKISKQCPETFCEDLPIEMRSVGDFLRQHYPQQDVLRPVKFYSDYFTESIGDIDVERLQRILSPVPTTILYSDISDYAVTFRVGFWGFLNNQEVSLFSTKVFEWEEAKDALLASGVSEKKALRMIRQLIVAIHKLLAGFLADLYYLNIDPGYEPLLFNLKDELAEYGLAEELVKPYFDILQDIQRRQREVYEKELKKLADAELKALEEFRQREVYKQELKKLAEAEAAKVFRIKEPKWRCVRTLKGHLGCVTSVAISSNGETIASGSYDRKIKLWNLQKGWEIFTFTGHSDYVTSVIFSPNGETIASGSDDEKIKLWNLKNGREILTFNGHSKGVNSVVFSPDGETIASGSEDEKIKLWNLKNGREILTFNGHSKGVNSVAFSRDGETIASGSEDDIKLWNIKNGREVCTLTGHSDCITSVAFSPNGETIVSGSDDGKIKLWNLKNGREIITFTGHSKCVNSVAFSPDGETIASGSMDNTIKLWNLKTGQEICTLARHGHWVISVTFSPDGNTLVSGSCDETIKIWRCDG